MNCTAGYRATVEGATTETEGCMVCAIGTFSAGEGSSECSPMNCPAGQIATKEAATSSTDGCEECGRGDYSPGGALLECLPVNCPVGTYATKTGATTPGDGCQACGLSKYSPGGRILSCAGVTELSAGANHTCACVNSGECFCWGYGNHGQLGTGSLGYSPTPVRLNLPEEYTYSSISAGQNHSCVVRSDGNFACWGQSSSGQLGYGDTVQRLTPVFTAEGYNAQWVFAGDRHSCFIQSTTGRVYCWGKNDYGQVAIGTIGGQYNSPQETELEGVFNLSLSKNNGCGVDFFGKKVYCWGDCSNYQLGSFSLCDSNDGATPVAVSALPLWTILDVSSGNNHSCSLINKIVRCWGVNSKGQLGSGNYNNSGPVELAVSDEYLKISAGGDHTCGVTTSNTVKCWGDNSDKQVTNSSTTKFSSPVTISSITDAVDVEVGSYHSCALLADGKVRCWGNNAYGQLGNGASSIDVGTPTYLEFH